MSPKYTQYLILALSYRPSLAPGAYVPLDRLAAQRPDQMILMSARLEISGKA